MLDSLDGKMHFSLPSDENGYTGRECPNPDCLGYFKIIVGTGLEGTTDCICPYCGYKSDHDRFFTPAQNEYIESLVINYASAKMLDIFKEFESKHRAGKSLISFKVTGTSEPIRYYQEEELETKLTCTNCTLVYSMYGVFAFCPDCGVHNSEQILSKNLELAEKEIGLADSSEHELADYLIADALENVVASFDGFGRELCRVYAAHVSNQSKTRSISFQNLAFAQASVLTTFGFDIAAGLASSDFDAVSRCFQKRHLLAHKMGVIDDDYIAKANDPGAIKGRKINISKDEVETLIENIRNLGKHMLTEMQKLT